MKKKYDTHAEDLLFVAERQYQRMLERVNQGIIDRDEIVAAMSVINNAHYVAIKENKRHLIK
jgi:hypothetical protein